jgi:putative flippase GtrA
MQARRAAARFLVGTIVYLAIVLGLRRLGVPPLAAFAVALVVGLVISRLVDRRMDRR